MPTPVRTRAKICGITRSEDALEAVRLGADALGFVFWASSPRAVTPMQAAELVALLPPFVTAVGLFVNPTEAEVRAALAAVPLDLLQFHGDETPDFCARFGRRYIKAVRMRPDVDLHAEAARFAAADGLLLDAYRPGVPGGTGEVFDWAAIPQDLGAPVVLAGGLDADNVAEAIRAVRPFAVDVSSGVEADKGIKDAAKMAAFLRGVLRGDSQ